MPSAPTVALQATATLASNSPDVARTRLNCSTVSKSLKIHVAYMQIQGHKKNGRLAW